MYTQDIEPTLGCKRKFYRFIQRKANKPCRRIKLQTLQQQRVANGIDYKRTHGLTMIWPPLPGTRFWDDVQDVIETSNKAREYLQQVGYYGHCTICGEPNPPQMSCGCHDNHCQ